MDLFCQSSCTLDYFALKFDNTIRHRWCATVVPITDTLRNAATKKNQIICLNCSGIHDTISGSPCEAPAFCKNCKGDHSPVSKECPVYREEEAIIRLKTDRGLTYAEARSEFREMNRGPSYSSTTQSRLVADEKDRTIELLRKEIDDLKVMIVALKCQIISQQQTHMSASASSNESMDDNVSISSEDPPNENAGALALATASRDHHISPQKIDTKIVTKQQNSANGNKTGKNNIESARITKRRVNETKIDGSPDSPERKKGVTLPGASKSHYSKNR